MGVVTLTTDGTTAHRRYLRYHLTHLVTLDLLLGHRRLRNRRLVPNRKFQPATVGAGRVRECDPGKLTSLKSSVFRTAPSGERGVQTLSMPSSRPQVGKMMWLKHGY